MPFDQWRIVADSQAARDLKKLHARHTPILPSILRIIDALAEHPYSGKPLKGNKTGCFSIRCGDFRIIYELHSPQRTVHLIRIGDRKEIYR